METQLISGKLELVSLENFIAQKTVSKDREENMKAVHMGIRLIMDCLDRSHDEGFEMTIWSSSC